MQMLKHVSGGKPVLFMDVSYIDDEAQIFYMPNCGAFCSWYARRSDDPAENLAQVQLRPANRPGGGAITYFTAAPGPLTFARLYRRLGRYQMSIVGGETVELPPEKVAAFVAARGSHQLPTAFARLDTDIDAFLDSFASNHILAVDGIYIEELVHLCRLLDVEPVLYSR
jgi:L-fucose isomerase